MELGFYNLSEHAIKNGSIFISDSSGITYKTTIDVYGRDAIAAANKDLKIIKKDKKLKKRVSCHDNRYGLHPHKPEVYKLPAHGL